MGRLLKSNILPKCSVIILNVANRTVQFVRQYSPLCLKIVDILGEPIISTSVPDGTDGFFTDPQEIIHSMENDVDMVLDAGILPSEPSTIVDLSQDTPEIIRQGAGDISLIY